MQNLTGPFRPFPVFSVNVFGCVCVCRLSRIPFSSGSRSSDPSRTNLPDLIVFVFWARAKGLGIHCVLFHARCEESGIPISGDMAASPSHTTHPTVMALWSWQRTGSKGSLIPFPATQDRVFSALRFQPYGDARTAFLILHCLVQKRFFLQFCQHRLWMFIVASCRFC